MSVQINGTNGLTFNDGSSQQTAASGFGFKNRIINGDFRIDQRNAGASVSNSAGANYYLDRWQVATAQASKMTIQQNAGSVTPPVGFSNYLGLTVTSAYTAGAADYYLFAQKIEGFNASDLGFGTANAKTVTISFQVYSSLTGTFCAALQNAAGNRTYIFNYTISSANTWTTITQTITGDTSGTWGSGNSSWGELKFDLGSGSNYQTSTVSSWAATGAFTTASAVKFVANASATFYITGVQLEKGSTATSFDYRPYGTELQLCQRYFWKSFLQGTAPANGVGTKPLIGSCAAWGSNSVYMQSYTLPVVMRTSATATAYRSDAGVTNGQWATYDGGWTSLSDTTIDAGDGVFSVSGSRTGAFTQYRAYPFNGNLTLSAEL